MPNIEWYAAQTIKSKFGDLDLNFTDPVTLRRFQVLPDGYKVVPSLRVTQDNISQRDGSVLHPRFTTGLVAQMTVRYQVNIADVEWNPACLADLVEMNDELTRWLNGMRDLVYADNQRYIWTPSSGGEDRMLLDVELLGWPDPAIGDQDASQVTFALETPFPYAVDVTETDTAIADGATETLLNDGSADTYPVIQVTGPFSTFTLTNLETGLLFEYDDSRPGAVGVGGGDYAEIDMFRGTIFLNGNSTDLIPGVVPTTTDFFPITCSPAGNDLTISGAACVVKWNRAWA